MAAPLSTRLRDLLNPRRAREHPKPSRRPGPPPGARPWGPGFRFAAETERVEVETSWDGPAHYVEVNVNWWSNAVRLEGLSDHVRGLIVKS